MSFVACFIRKWSTQSAHFIYLIEISTGEALRVYGSLEQSETDYLYCLIKCGSSFARKPLRQRHCYSMLLSFFYSRKSLFNQLRITLDFLLFFLWWWASSPKAWLVELLKMKSFRWTARDEHTHTNRHKYAYLSVDSKCIEIDIKEWWCFARILTS